MIDEFVEFFIQQLDKELHSVAGVVLAGTSNWENYRTAVGVIQGMTTAKEVAKECAKRFSEDDEEA